MRRDMLQKAIDQLDMTLASMIAAPDLRAIVEAQRGALASRLHLAACITDAREHGRTWGQIAQVVGTSKQSVHDRFSDV